MSLFVSHAFGGLPMVVTARGRMGTRLSAKDTRRFHMSLIRTKSGWISTPSKKYEEKARRHVPSSRVVREGLAARGEEALEKPGVGEDMGNKGS